MCIWLMPDFALPQEPWQYLFCFVVNMKSSVGVDVSLIPLYASLTLCDEMNPDVFTEAASGYFKNMAKPN